MGEIFKLFGTIVVKNDDANDAIDSTAKKANEGSSKMVESFKKIGAAVAAAFTVKAIVDFGKKCVEAAATVKATNAQFEQTFGDMADQATKSIQKVSEESGIMETRLKGVGTSIYAFAKSSGADSATAMELMETALKATADAAAYYDRSLEDTSESLQSFLKGNFANDAALGVSCTETTRNAAAMELFGKKYNDLSEIQKQQTLLKMVTDAQKLSGAMGQASREADGWENVTGNLKEAWNQFLAVVGAPILSALVPIVKAITSGFTMLGDALRKVQEFFEKHKILASVLAGLFVTLTVAVLAYNVALNAAAIAEGLLAAASTAAAAATTAFGAALAFLTSPITLVVVAIGALIAICVALYKNWDSFVDLSNDMADAITEDWERIKKGVENSKVGQATSKVMEAMENTVSQKLNNIKVAFQSHGGGVKGIMAATMEGIKGVYSSGFTFLDNLTGGMLSTISGKFQSKFVEIKNLIFGKLEEMKAGVSEAIEKIKGFFRFEWSLPKIKLPHFKIDGKFSLFPPSIPKITVDWYKKAMNNPMIMNQPTAFGINANGQIMAGGEAGSEVVSGTNTLMNMIASAVAAQNQKTEETLLNIQGLLSQYMPQMANMQMVTDTGALVGALAPRMDNELGKMQKIAARGI